LVLGYLRMDDRYKSIVAQLLAGRECVFWGSGVCVVCVRGWGGGIISLVCVYSCWHGLCVEVKEQGWWLDFGRAAQCVCWASCAWMTGTKALWHNCG
jgi:hypothetical protein